jgi:hypothetical protein
MTGFVKMTYVQLNEQVTLQSQDPVKCKAGLKSSLIDLEALTIKTRVTRPKDFLKDGCENVY